MIAWTDIESTGLREREDHLLEVALVVTDDNLTEVAATSVVMKPVGVDITDVQMEDVVKQMHTRNNLLAEVAASGVERAEAEQRLIDFTREAFKGVPDIATHECVKCKKREEEHHAAAEVLVCPVPEDQQHLTVKIERFEPKMLTALSQTPVAGSTVAFDRAWLREHVPEFHKLFHYRSIDVSAITELARRWAPALYKNRPKNEAGAAHRALADIRESIEYLRYWRKTYFLGGDSLVSKLRALEEEALSIFDDMTGHEEFDPQRSGPHPIPVSDSHVASLAVALFSVQPLSDRGPYISGAEQAALMGSSAVQVARVIEARWSDGGEHWFTAYLADSRSESEQIEECADVESRRRAEQSGDSTAYLADFRVVEKSLPSNLLRTLRPLPSRTHP